MGIVRRVSRRTARRTARRVSRRRFLLGTGLLATAAVGGYAAYKSRRNADAYAQQQSQAQVYNPAPPPDGEGT